jgi:DNA-binding CsgD family transcriptional regulator
LRRRAESVVMNVLDQERDLPELIDLIYDAAVDPTLWPRFLDRLCDMAPGAKSVMMMHDANTRSINASVTARWEEDWTTSYTDYYVKHNQWTAEFAHFDVGRAMIVDDIVPRAVTMKSEFYEDWLRPQNLVTGVTVSVFKENLRYMNFSVLYQDADDDLQKRNVAILQELSPHLRRAGQVHRQISGLTFQSRAIEQAFDSLNRGVVLLQPDGRCFYYNDRAKRFLDMNDGLIQYRDGRIGCQDAEAEADLYRALLMAGKTAQMKGSSPGDIIAVPRRSSALPWSLMIAPIPASALDFGYSNGAVVVFIVDPEQKPVISVAGLRAVLGLTASEARVAIALAEGLSPEEIAKLHGNAILTVRTHLRNAMGKAGVSRLAELVALVLRCQMTAES